MRSLLLATSLTLAAVAPALAGSGLEVLQPWARAPAGNGPGALYMTLHDAGAADRLTGVTTDAGGMAMLHESASSNGVETMRDLSGVALPAGGTVVMRPGGIHVMLMDLGRKLRAGDTLHATLSFAHAAPLTITVPVYPPGSPGPH